MYQKQVVKILFYRIDTSVKILHIIYYILYNITNRRFKKRRGEGVFLLFKSAYPCALYHPLGFACAFLTPFSFAKVQRLSSMPSTSPDGRYFWQKSRSSLPQIAVSIWVFREIFTEIPWRRPIVQPLVKYRKEKGLKAKRSR